MNARVQKAMSREESKIIGQYTFEPDTANPLSRSEEVIENRQMLIEFCETHQLLLVNTLFLPPNKRVTYREIGVNIEADFQRGTHEQIDFIIAARRWRNSVTNAESDAGANIDSDHYPVIATLRIKLKAIQAARTSRLKSGICTETQRISINERLKEALREENRSGDI